MTEYLRRRYKGNKPADKLQPVEKSVKEIMSPNGNTIKMDDVQELDFNLPEVVEPKEEAEASTDDLQSDLRVLYRLMTLFAKRAGISQEEIESCQEDP